MFLVLLQFTQCRVYWGLCLSRAFPCGVFILLSQRFVTFNDINFD